VSEIAAAPAWRVTVLTLFPEMFPGFLGYSLAGKALSAGIWSLETVDIRDFASDKHRSVDDAPFGGGPGMVLMPEVVDRALGAHHRGPAPAVYLTPRGRRLDQAMVRGYAARTSLTLICGRFEGVDERVIEQFGIEEVSIGDYVLTGGEIAAQAVIDASLRLIPRVLGNEASAGEDSFTGGLLEYPQYTKPAVWEGRAIPEVLLSGHHVRIADWRRAEAERLTRERRPDLWRAYLEKG
jgi:tRNA (guanine37-N1)-methyltransferase